MMSLELAARNFWNFSNDTNLQPPNEPKDIGIDHQQSLSVLALWYNILNQQL